MFSFEYITRYGDYRDFERVKSAVVLDIAQDIAIRNSEECGYGLHVMREKNMAWLLQGVKVHFEKPLSIRCPLSVKTAVKNMKGVTSERGCIIEQNGQTVAKTISNWFLCDTNTLLPCRIPAEMAAAYGLHDFGDPFFRYEKPALQKAGKLYSLRVTPRDIDTNRHLNNYKSAEMLTDALPPDFFFSGMSVYYKRSAYLGDELELCAAKTEKGWYAHLQTADGEICVAASFEK